MARTSLTLESLVKRIEALENAIAMKGTGPARKDWRKVVVCFATANSCAKFDEECLRMRRGGA